MKNTDQNEVKTLDISDYTVTFYRGSEGFQNKCRVIVALYDMVGKLSAWIKFYNEGVEIENECTDENGLIQLNLPHSNYLDVLYTLRSRRPLQLILYDNHAMLQELKSPPPRKKNKGINLN